MNYNDILSSNEMDTIGHKGRIDIKQFSHEVSVFNLSIRALYIWLFFCIINLDQRPTLTYVDAHSLPKLI